MDNLIFDLAKTPLREVNHFLHNDIKTRTISNVTILNPDGAHNIAAGMNQNVSILIDGHAGYYAGGMNQLANITIAGSAATGVAENMMSGIVHVKGFASNAAGATAQGGLLIIDGDAGLRCGILLKGADIVVGGSVGSFSGFMAQGGNLVVLGDAGDALGDSLYEVRIFVRGKVKSLGSDCEEKTMAKEDSVILQNLLQKAGHTNVSASEFKLYGSARTLYNFHVDNVGAY